MKTLPILPVLLFLSLLSLPLNAEIRGAARAGVFANSGHDAVGTIELDARQGNWAIAPAWEFIRGGYGLNAIHVDVRRIFPTTHFTFWAGAGPTFVRTNVPSSETTWNADAGMAWRTSSAWEPFIAARYYKVRLPVFRDVIDNRGAVLSIGISRRFH